MEKKIQDKLWYRSSDKSLVRPVDSPCDNHTNYGNCYICSRRIASLPALTNIVIDPEYAATLKDGWVNVERVSRELKQGCWSVYNGWNENKSRVAGIGGQPVPPGEKVAPVEKGEEPNEPDHWKNFDVLIKAAVDKAFCKSGLKAMALNGSDGEFKEVEQRFFDTIDIEYLKSRLKPTQHTGTGDFDTWLFDTKWANPTDDAGVFMANELKVAFQAGQAASGSDAVAFAKFKDTNYRLVFGVYIHKDDIVKPLIEVSQFYDYEDLYKIFKHTL